MIKFLIISSISMVISSAYASDKDWVVYDWELELTLSRIPSSLANGGHSFTDNEIMPIFGKLAKMKPRDTVVDSKGDDSDISSTGSRTSTLSHEYVEAMEELISTTFNFEKPTADQEKNRHSFIVALHSLEDKVDPIVFQKGLELIANTLDA